MQLTICLHFDDCNLSFGEDNAVQTCLFMSRFCKSAKKWLTPHIQKRLYLGNLWQYNAETLGLTPHYNIYYCVKKLAKSKMVTRELFSNLVELTWNDPIVISMSCVL